jgi:hypothetical protein
MWTSRIGTGFEQAATIAWREMSKQAVTVLNYKGAEITEENIKDTLGPKWAWKMGKLFQSVWFVEDDWQELGTREEIAEHNFKVQARWLASGGDLTRKFWWHVTEITLDHLRPSPQWKRAMEELQLAKECEAATRRGLKELAERRWQEAEKHRMLREVLEELAFGAQFPPTIQRPINRPLPSWGMGQT